jgi:hypothetical protein
MKIIYSKKGSELPFEEVPREARKAKALKGGGNYWGAFSLQNFCNAGGLSHTHEDAGGWLAYLEQFNPRNFWYKDNGVRIWAYYDYNNYDDWLDTYGMDAVLAVYHSGHGGMDGNGTFYAPLGADWSGKGCTAVSSEMRFGDEHVNYIFWSTCVSCRVLEGHNPIQTWASANEGFRMLFGFETTSWDSPNYGSAFWKHWNMGKSLSTAWLDASWYDVAHDQAPSVVACGSNAQEAQDRLFNERYFYWDHVSNDWWWWRWYYAATAAIATRELNRALPKELLVAELKPIDINEQYVRGVLERCNIEMKLPSDVMATRDGIFHLKEGATRIAFGSEGTYELQLAQPNLSNRDHISLNKAKSIAHEAVKRYGLSEGISLTFDRIRLAAEGGSSREEAGHIEGPYITETTVQFRQVINRLPVLTQGTGEVSISIDNDGTVTGLHCGIRPVERLVDHPKNTTSTPSEEGPVAKPRARDVTGYEQMLAEEWTKRLASWVIRGKAPLQYTVVPGSTEIGYDIRGNEAILVARRAVEVELGNEPDTNVSYKKRYWVMAPILE